MRACSRVKYIPSGRVGEQTCGSEMDRFIMLVFAKIIDVFIGATREEV